MERSKTGFTRCGGFDNVVVLMDRGDFGAAVLGTPPGHVEHPPRGRRHTRGHASMRVAISGRRLRGRVDGRTDGRTDARTDARTHAQMHARMDGNNARMHAHSHTGKQARHRQADSQHTRTHTGRHARIHSRNVRNTCTHTGKQAIMHARTHARTHARAHTCTHTHTRTHTRKHASEQAGVHASNTHRHACTHACTDGCFHVRTYTRSNPCMPARFQGMACRLEAMAQGEGRSASLRGVGLLTLSMSVHMSRLAVHPCPQVCTNVRACALLRV